MEKYTCEDCGGSFTKGEMDSDSLKEEEHYCKKCAYFLREAAWDAVDPNRNFQSYEDWDKHGH